ncbi:MAG: lysylphosphatidylglycerol synthase transmembrane domain-containing protein [Candidatus Hinthialibacter antarcticus]|nr:lysylphosphatidylglycerol synthase transmembrane domain-containing protein [Candidatus Hinthialibacter antarcticus]
MKSRWLQFLIAIIIGGVCLFLFARSVPNWGEVWSAILKANYGLLAIAVLLGLSTIYIRAWRWRSFLGEPKVSSWKLFLIGGVGFMANGVLPARMGELIRPFLVSRMTPHKFAAALATIVVERVFDLLVILSLLAYSLWMFPLENTAADGSAPAFSVNDLGQVGAGVLVILATAVAVMSYAPHWTIGIIRFFGKFLPHGLVDKLIQIVHSFEKGSSTFRRPRSFLYCTAISLLLWLVIAFSELLVIWAFGITHVDMNGALLFMSALCFAVMFPQAPGYLGPYQIVAAMVLTHSFGVEPSTAGAIAITMWFTQVPPVIAMGLPCMAALNVSFHDLTHTGEQIPQTELDAQAD